jgi:hypothetical protein
MNESPKGVYYRNKKLKTVLYTHKVKREHVMQSLEGVFDMNDKSVSGLP